MLEDGVNTGTRNIGRFFLWAIPLVLGLAASVWLGVYVGIHDFHHELSQEERAAVYTGAGIRPTSKLAIEVMPHDCFHITKADIDGNDLLIYGKDDCHEQESSYTAWHWALVSPDGTTIGGGYTNWECPQLSSYGEKAECHMKIDSDDRAEKLRVWIANDTK